MQLSHLWAKMLTSSTVSSWNPHRYSVPYGTHFLCTVSVIVLIKNAFISLDKLFLCRHSQQTAFFCARFKYIYYRYCILHEIKKRSIQVQEKSRNWRRLHCYTFDRRHLHLQDAKLPPPSTNKEPNRRGYKKKTSFAATTACMEVVEKKHTVNSGLLVFDHQRRLLTFANERRKKTNQNFSWFVNYNMKYWCIYIHIYSCNMKAGLSLHFN